MIESQSSRLVQKHRQLHNVRLTTAGRVESGHLAEVGVVLDCCGQNVSMGVPFGSKRRGV